MKNPIIILLFLAMSQTMNAQKLYLTIGETTLTATLADNSSARALMQELATADITYEAHDYGNFEKVGDLGRTLPRNDENITTQAGDLILYLGRNLCIYYDTNTWNFTRIGRIDNVTQEQLKRVLGTGNVTVMLSASVPTGIKLPVVEGRKVGKPVAINGIRTPQTGKGVYIIRDGKKVLR